MSTVTGDRYGGEWLRERFSEYGITYLVGKKVRSELYLELLPLLNSGRVELLDHPRLVKQLCELERRTARSGKDSIDHPPGSHDDIGNAVAGAIWLAAKKQIKLKGFVGDWGDSPSPAPRGLSDMHDRDSDSFGYFDGGNIDSWIRGR